MAVTPITPDEAGKAKSQAIPDEVIAAFNDLIAQTYSNGRSHFTLERVVALLVTRGFTKVDLYNNHWLDVEPIFRSAGWIVEYDQPGYNESYDATYTFKRPLS